VSKRKGYQEECQQIPDQEVQLLEKGLLG